jgi:IMP dehydrogenase/GMP reductase
MVGQNNLKFKSFRGMASREAQREWRGKVSVPEGVSSSAPYKGPVSAIIEAIVKGVQSGLSYSGARNLKQLRTKCEFISQKCLSGIMREAPHVLNRLCRLFIDQSPGVKNSQGPPSQGEAASINLGKK